MPEHIICRCPFCRVKLKLGNLQLEGKRIKCPKCAEPFVVAAITETSIDQDAPTTVSKSRSVASVPSRIQKKAPPQPASSDEDWLNDLNDIEDSPGQQPLIVRKKKKPKASADPVERKRSEEGCELPLIVHYLMMAGTGLISGLIGAAIWAGLIYSTGFEIGYVAVLVGFLSGIGVRFGASQWDYGLGPGLAAVAVAIMALIAGKVAGYQLIIQRELGNMQVADTPVMHENFFIAALAEQVKAAAPNALAAGEPNLNGNAETDPEEFDPEKLPLQYPPEIWNQAKARWDALTDEEKKTLQDEGNEQIQELAKPQLSLIFGPFDILWSVLAIGAAFRAATGGQEE